MYLRHNFKQDRRRRKRQLLNTSVRVFTKSGCIEAIGINLSDVGMCLFTIANLPLGSQVEVEFIPLRGTHPKRICATVRHRALYLYGIEFRADSSQAPNAPLSKPLPAAMSEASDAILAGIAAPDDRKGRIIHEENE